MIAGISRRALTNIAAVGAGGIAASYIEGVIPIQDPRLRSGAVVLAGAAIAGMGDGMVRYFGFGVGAVGAANLIKAFVPNLA